MTVGSGYVLGKLVRSAKKVLSALYQVYGVVFVLFSDRGKLAANIGS